jgi:hypothetical protein
MCIASSLLPQSAPLFSARAPVVPGFALNDGASVPC